MNNRLYFLDTLRTFTIGLVIFYHVTILYTKQFQFLDQFVKNPTPETFDLLFLVLIFFISGAMLNSIMFFIAGYFAFASYEKKGERLFIADKLKRLGIPYLLGLVILSPITLFIARLSRDKNVKLGHFWIKEFFLPEIITPNHLWFIGILLIFFIIFIPLFARLKTKKSRQIRNSQTLIYVLFLLLTFVVYFCLSCFYKPYNFLSIYIVDFPVVMLLIYAGYFLLGVYASRRQWFNNENKEPVFPWVIVYVVNIAIYFGTLIIAGIDPMLNANHPLLAFSVNGMMFSGVFLLIAVFKKYQNKPSNLKSWLSKNSYGAYIFHYIIVFAVVYWMLDVPLPFILKYFIQIFLCPFLSWGLTDLLKKIQNLLNNFKQQCL